MLLFHYLVSFFLAGVSKERLNLFLQVYGTSFFFSFISPVNIVYHILFFQPVCSCVSYIKSRIYRSDDSSEHRQYFDMFPSGMGGIQARNIIIIIIIIKKLSKNI